MAKRSVKSIAQMSQYELGKLTKAELQPIYRELRSAVQRRLKTFERHNETGAVPKRIRELGAPSKLSKKDLIKSIGAAGNFYTSERGTYSGYRRERRKLKVKMEKRIGTPMSEEAFDNLGAFMGEMRDRAKDMFNNISGKAVELYAAAKDKGMDPKQFLRNYEYWTDENNLEKFKEADPISRGRKVYPSDYIKALGLPTIKSYEDNKYNED